MSVICVHCGFIRGRECRSGCENSEMTIGGGRGKWRCSAALVTAVILSMVSAHAGVAPVSARTSKPKPKPKPKPATTVKRATTTTVPTDRSFSVPTGPMTEVSGCAIAPSDGGTLWVHNDSGNAAEIFGVDLKTKAVRRVEVSGAENVDWEDIAPMPDGGLLIGDIGDNQRSRESIRLISVNELTGPTTAAVVSTVAYDDGAHDAEALVVNPEPGQKVPAVYVITKEASGRSAVYRAGATTLTRVAEVTVKGEVLLFPNQITAAHALPDGSGIVLRTYQYVYLLRRPAGRAFEAAFSADPERIAIPFLIQAEALCVTPDGKSLVTTTEARGAETLRFVVVPRPR